MNSIEPSELKIILELGYYDGPVSGILSYKGKLFAFEELAWKQLKNGAFRKTFLLVPVNEQFLRSVRDANSENWRSLVLNQIHDRRDLIFLYCNENIYRVTSAWKFSDKEAQLGVSFEGLEAIGVKIQGGYRGGLVRALHK